MMTIISKLKKFLSHRKKNLLETANFDVNKNKREEMNKYRVEFCRCGRVHFIENRDINKAIDNNKVLLHVCTTCGKTLVIGSDIERTEDDEQLSHIMYSYSIRNEIIDNISRIDKIIINEGTCIPMKTGGVATHYDNKGFVDTLTQVRPNIKLDVMEQKRRSVNMIILLHHLEDDKIQALSEHRIRGFDWNGTKYKNKH